MRCINDICYGKAAHPEQYLDIYLPMMFIVSDNDMQNRYEQTQLVLSTLILAMMRKRYITSSCTELIAIIPKKKNLVKLFMNL